MKRSFLDNHYDSILTANREKILAGGNGDAFLEKALTDSRMALVVLIRIPSVAAEKINRCIDDLKGIEPNLYYYPAEDFHITVMDVLKGEEGRRIPPNINEYIRCIEECSKDISPFKVKERSAFNTRIVESDFGEKEKIDLWGSLSPPVYKSPQRSTTPPFVPTCGQTTPEVALKRKESK